MESEKFKETKEEDRGAYKYESVVSSMSKSLIEKILFELLHVVCVWTGETIVIWIKQSKME